MYSFKKSDFNLLEINFEYKNQIITLNAEPYKTLDYIFEKAVNKLNKTIGLPSNIHFYFLGQDLNGKNTEKIGNLFNHREKVTIKIKGDTNDKDNNSKRNNYNIINKKNNIYLLNTKIIRPQKNLNFTKLQNSNKLIFPGIKLPPLKKEIKNENKENDNYTQNLCACGRLRISEYCRNCRKFICIKCKAELKHKDHLSIHLNMVNISDSVKDYGKIVQDDIQKKIEINRNLNTKSAIIDESTMINKKQLIQNKYKEALETYKAIISQINLKLQSENKEQKYLIINAYKEYSSNIIKQLNELNKKLDKDFISSNKKLTFNDLRNFFVEINNKEDSLNFFGKDLIKYKLKEEIKIKMKSSLYKINKILDLMCDEDLPFNLDSKYLEELTKLDLVKKNKEKKDKEKDDIDNNNMNNISNINYS